MRYIYPRSTIEGHKHALILKRLKEIEGKWESRGIKVIIETERDQGPRHPSETRNKGLNYVFTLIFPISEVPLL
jgi:hypothetical protein